MPFRRSAGLITAIGLATAPTIASAQYTQAELDWARTAAEEAERKEEAQFPLLYIGIAALIAVLGYLVAQAADDDEQPLSP